jgi:hypothetical protein
MVPLNAKLAKERKLLPQIQYLSVVTALLLMLNTVLLTLIAVYRLNLMKEFITTMFMHTLRLQMVMNLKRSLQVDPIISMTRLPQPPPKVEISPLNSPNMLPVELGQLNFMRMVQVLTPIIMEPHLLMLKPQ